MKQILILVALVASIFSVPVAAYVPSQGAATTSTATTSTLGGQNNTQVGTTVGASVGVNPKAKKKKIKPGNCHDNGDVNVCNTGDHGSILVTPENGDKDSATNIKTGTGSRGDITGLDGNDKVKVGSSSDMTITGTGGTITMQGGSSAQVNNLGGDGSTNMTLILPGGSTVSVPPGSSIFIQN